MWVGERAARYRLWHFGRDHGSEEVTVEEEARTELGHLLELAAFVDGGCGKMLKNQSAGQPPHR